MEDLYKELDDMEEAANKDGKATDAEKDAIDKLKEKYGINKINKGV